jgi:single-strand DNA-binding protein
MSHFSNSISVVGNLGNDIHISTTQKGFKVARFSLAQNVRSGDQVKTSWYQMFAWGNQAAILEKLGKKGIKLAVYGKIVNRTYVNKLGQKRKVSEVEVQQVEAY